MQSQDSFKTAQTLESNGKTYHYYNIKTAEAALGADIARLPYSLKILLENLLRYEDGRSVSKEDIEAFATWVKNQKNPREIAYRPARVLMQDFTGVPAVVDLAAMRDAIVGMGEDAQKINPLSPVDLVIDHSVMVDNYGTDSAFDENVELEMTRNKERYEFLRWGQKAFDNFRVVPPGTGICHQVNLEYLGQCVWTKEVDGKEYAYPDTLVGTDSHTTMINGLGVLGWGVGGIEAEAAMLGQPISMVIPEVVGFKLTGKLPEGMTATDLVLKIVKMLRDKGVVGKFVEFYGEGLKHLSLADRATIANMAPEYGATCGIFPIDEETLNYLRLTGRDEDRVALVEAYAKAQGMWRDDSANPVFTDVMALNLSTIEPAISGPKRPQDMILLADAAPQFVNKDWADLNTGDTGQDSRVAVKGKDFDLGHGDVVIAAITSCTNTSNPSVMLAAGLVAQKARALGMQVKPWVKTSLAPGSQVVTEYLNRAGLSDELDGLGFNLVGYGCTTCIGNSGPLMEPVEDAIKDNKLVVTSVLSGNRNFEGRVHQNVRGNYLASPPLVVAYALAGSMNIDITTEPLGQDRDGNDVFLKDVWPTSQEVSDTVARCVTREMFEEKYSDVFTGPEAWQNVAVGEGQTYDWQGASTYVRLPSFFDGMDAPANSDDIKGAKLLALLGDSITTDHISPAGGIAPGSPAAEYLEANGVDKKNWNSYGSRRGNHEVMMRGTFANVRIRNQLAPGTEGGWTTYLPTGDQMSIYDAAMKYAETETPLVVMGGKEYGTGSSRDWAAKGTTLLGVKAVITESFERIHRSNLIGMGVLPLSFKDGMSHASLGIDGSEVFDVKGLDTLKPGCDVALSITKNGETQEVQLLCRIDTLDELDYYRSGGILRYVLKNLAA
ncbi:MAG: aconitate hydratase AcnA [Rickettsiales bacterium]|nr:aconitate hydratase AcnA [Rickettsiales bacterium]